MRFLVLAALRAGFAHGRREAEDERVLQHDLALHARDRHFDHLPQIPRA